MRLNGKAFIRSKTGPVIPGFVGAPLMMFALCGMALAQFGPPPMQANATYTAAQAAAGQTAFASNCGSCHGPNLDDGEFAPPLRGGSFLQKWGGKPLSEVFNYTTSKMPPDRPNGLGDSVYAEIFAYILQQNGMPPGTKELPTSEASLKEFALPPGPPAGPSGGMSPGVRTVPAPKKTNPLDRYMPVTDAMLANPSPNDWLTWRRTYDDHGFSPLKQITKNNVGNLRVAWTWSLPQGPNQATPLVHDGVMFLFAFGDRVQALDAATGDQLWQYSRQLPRDVRPSVKKNIALYGDKVYVATSDMHVVALEAKTGKVVWDEPIVDPITGFSQTGGPLIAKGKVMVGTAGRVPGKNYIVALDANTGKEAWRFNTIAQPGEPNGNSWNGIPVEARNGASVWVAGSYDPALNLAFFGVAQTYDTGPLRNLVNQPGVTNDALYTDTTLAFNPDTGKLVWYFQHQPNDQWDLDWVFERVVVNLPVNGINKKLVVTSGKQAIYDALEADTGKYAFSIDLGLQNLVTAIDPKTGAKTIDQRLIPGDGEAKMVCPHAGGSKNWIPESYNPDTKMLYVPLAESCMDLIPVGPGGRGSLSTGVRWAIRPRPESDGKFGQLAAINLQTRKIVWAERQRAAETSGALATAGGVVFHGALDRSFKAVDDATGKLLWQTRLSDIPNNAPISYSVNGKQYIAVGVGGGGAWPVTYQVLLPEIQSPSPGSAIWVFELPGPVPKR
jgi:alcohol dehydrogenase (cytochrome c)